jgi:hypothetical protein
MKRLFNNVVAQIRVIDTGLFTSAIVLFLFGVAPAASAAELIVNGGFEEPV